MENTLSKHPNVDFIGFTYKDCHCIRDLNIYRVSGGDRYNMNLLPTQSVKT